MHFITTYFSQCFIFYSLGPLKGMWLVRDELKEHLMKMQFINPYYHLYTNFKVLCFQHPQ